MFLQTLENLICPKPKCAGELTLRHGDGSGDIRSGAIECKKCRKSYPILEGVAVLVADPREYVLAHVKGVAACVPESQIPKAWRTEFEEARDELVTEHIEEDLEAERVTSLYVMNHYLQASGGVEWWKGHSGGFSPQIDEWIRRFWDSSVFSRIASWLPSMDCSSAGWNVVEVGCGVGGLLPKISSQIQTYLGADSSFASIAIARHLALGCQYRGKLRFPEDLLAGPVSRELPLPKRPSITEGAVDFIVSDIEGAALASKRWNLSIALNAIDMLEDPSVLPRLQHRLLRAGGKAIQSGPYIWHQTVAAALRERLPQALRADSSRAVEWLYSQEGFQIEKREDHVPWLFFKHLRQLELYSVHLFLASLR